MAATASRWCEGGFVELDAVEEARRTTRLQTRAVGAATGSHAHDAVHLVVQLQTEVDGGLPATRFVDGHRQQAREQQHDGKRDARRLRAAHRERGTHADVRDRADRLGVHAALGGDCATATKPGAPSGDSSGADDDVTGHCIRRPGSPLRPGHLVIARNRTR